MARIGARLRRALRTCGESSRVTTGWDGRIGRGALHAANFPLPSESTGWLRSASAGLAANDVLLASLRVEAGDFYRGKLEPARFPERAGWSVGASDTRDARADGDWLTSWAATVPYLDNWYSWPGTTLHSLPRNGVLLWLTLQRGNRFPPDPHGNAGPPEREPPFDLDDFERRASWEGQVRDLPEYILWGTVRGEYQVDLRVYFGQPEPTDAMLDEAQTMLDGLRLPEWGPWELDKPR